MLDNFPLKAVSLALAVMLWYVIAGEKTSEMGVTVPVELQNVPPELELTGDPVNAVQVRLRASPGVIQRLGPGDISARIDLHGLEEGERIVHLTSDSMRVPFGVKVVKITPAIITLHFERTLTKTVPVRPRLLGRPAEGQEVAEVTSEPAEVRLAGPKSRVQEVESAFTEPVSVDGARTTIVDEVTIGLEDPLLRIEGSPRVRVTARVRETQVTRALEGVAITVRNGEGAVRPAAARVSVAGPASLVTRLNGSEVRAYVDVAAARPGAMVPVVVELAPGHAGLTLKDWQPAQALWRPGRGTAP
ncbi:MAG TPA: CdaR family protein [Vicinamibacteria bacterium]